MIPILLVIIFTPLGYTRAVLETCVSRIHRSDHVETLSSRILSVSTLPFPPEEFLSAAQGHIKNSVILFKRLIKVQLNQAVISETI